MWTRTPWFHAFRPTAPQAEFLLWDDDLALISLLPLRGLVLVVGAMHLTSGDAAPGGAPAQIGLNERTYCAVVDETDEAGGWRSAAGRPSKRLGAEGSPAQPPPACCLGRVCGPPALNQAAGWPPSVRLHLASYAGDPAAAKPAGEGGGEGGAAVARAWEGVVTVELHEAHGADGEVCASLCARVLASLLLCVLDQLRCDTSRHFAQVRRLLASVHSGHSLVITGLSRRASGSLGGASPPSASYSGDLGEGSRVRLTNLSCLPCALRSPLLHHPPLRSRSHLPPAPVETGGWSGGAPGTADVDEPPHSHSRVPSVGPPVTGGGKHGLPTDPPPALPSLREGLASSRSAEGAMVCSAMICGWTNVSGADGGLVASAQSAPTPEGVVVAHGMGDASFLPILLDLTDDFDVEYGFSGLASPAVLEELCDASAAELAEMRPEEQRKRLAQQMYVERAWALTRELSPEGGLGQWRVNTTARLPQQ